MIKAKPSSRHEGRQTVDLADFALSSVGMVGREVPARFRELIEATSRRPEIRPLSSSVSFTTEHSMTVPFRVCNGYEVVINPRSAANPPLLAVHLRHALELALLQRRLNLPEQPFWRRAAAAILACHVAAAYFESLVFLEQELVRPHLPKGLLSAFERSASALSNLEAAELRETIIDLLALQGETPATDAGVWQQSGAQEARTWAERLMPLAAPTEVVISRGGDSRSNLNSRSGLNNYGCCPRPRPWAVTFASSTASSISDLAYQRVEQTRGDLIESDAIGVPGEAYDRMVADVRKDLCRLLGVETDSTDVILSGSGTDAELYALYLATLDVDCRVTNIVVAPEETGSGVVCAASGQHFSSITASGIAVRPGDMVRGFDPERIRLETVSVRGDDGELLGATLVDDTVERLVEDAIKRGDRVLLHLVDASKTGLGAPSLQLVKSLAARHSPRIDVIVDACQARVDIPTLHAYLELGWMVMVTGSKFFTGPPFSGALLVPHALGTQRASSLPAPPEGLADYCAPAQWPPTWRRQRDALPEWRNSGLLLRWQAALWEMAAFYSVGAAERLSTLRQFGQRVQKAIERCEVAHLVSWSGYDRSALGPVREFDALQTIFTFTLLRPDESGVEQPLSLEETQAIYHWLNVDISHQMPMSASEAELALAQRRFHIGQPVKLGRHGSGFIGALRISAGARLVSGVAHDPVLGPTSDVRLEREITDAIMILEKITLIMRNFDYLSMEILPPTTDMSLLYMT